MRIELPDGQWAEVRERISHGARKQVIRTVRDEDDLEAMSAITMAYVTAWEVKDIDGVPIPLDPAATAASFDRLPDDLAKHLYGEILERWKRLTDTSPTPPSSDA